MSVGSAASLSRFSGSSACSPLRTANKPELCLLLSLYLWLAGALNPLSPTLLCMRYSCTLALGAGKTRSLSPARGYAGGRVTAGAPRDNRICPALQHIADQKP